MVNTKLEIVFSEEMVQSTLTAGNIVITGSESVAGSFVYDSAKKKVVFTPDKILQSDVTHSVSITTNVKDVNGGGLSKDYKFSFKTMNAPIVTSISPVDASVNIERDSSITVVFSKDILESKLNDTTVELKSSSVAVAKTISYNSLTKTLTIKPSVLLNASTEYTVNLSKDITDLNSTPLFQAYSNKFTTLGAQFGTGEDGDITILAGNTVKIIDLYENFAVTGVVTKNGYNKGLNHGSGNYDPKNGKYVNAKNFTIESTATLTTDAYGTGGNDKLGIVWIACTQKFQNDGTVDLSGKGWAGANQRTDDFIDGYDGYGTGGGKSGKRTQGWHPTLGSGWMKIGGFGGGAGFYSNGGTGSNGDYNDPSTTAYGGTGGVIYGDISLPITTWINLYGSGGGGGVGDEGRENYSRENIIFNSKDFSPGAALEKIFRSVEI